MTVLLVAVLVAGGSVSASASEPVPNLQKLAASLVDWVVVC
jgi:hypothetical protein